MIPLRADHEVGLRKLNQKHIYRLYRSHMEYLLVHIESGFSVTNRVAYFVQYFPEMRF